MGSRTFTIPIIFIATAAGVAHADTEEPADTQEQADTNEYPTDFTLRPLTLQAGMLELGAGVATGAGSDNRFDPTGLMLDAGYGITDRLMARVRIGDAMQPFGLGLGLCVTDRCAATVGAVDATVSYHVISAFGGMLDVAGDVGGELDTFDPLRARAHLGGRFRYAGGAMGLAITVDPRIEVGLNQRGAMNPDAVVIPVRGHFPLGGVFDSWAGVIYGLPLTPDLDDVLLLDVGAVFTPVAVSKAFDIGLQARYPMNDSSGDAVVSMFARYRP